MTMTRRPNISNDSIDASVPEVRTWARFCGPAALALILLATILIYLPSIQGRFLWDDDANVTQPDLQSPHGLYRIWFEFGATQQYYPLLHTAFWVEHQLWGDHPTGYHIISLFWHLISVVLVYAILNRLEIPGAVFGAALFAVHPVMVESVAWITEQKNTLSTVFYLSSMLAYLIFDERRQRAAALNPSPSRVEHSKGRARGAPAPIVSAKQGRWYLAALLLFVLAILAKSAVVTLPAALLVIAWWQRGEISWRRDVLPLLPFFLAAALMGIATCYVEWKHVGASGAEFELSRWQRLLLAGRAVWFYLYKLFWPANLIFIYPRWVANPSEWWQWIYPIAAMAMTAALWAIRNWSRAPLAAWLFFCGTLLPMLPFLNQYVFLYTFVCDHFLYVASLGIFALVAGTAGALLHRLPKTPRVLSTAICIAAVALLVVQSWSQSHVYENSSSLFETTIDRNPKCWMAYNNYGVFLSQNNNFKRALECFQKSLEINPNNPHAHANLGSALAEQGNLEEAIKQFRKSISISPGFLASYESLGRVLTKAGRFSDAVDCFETELSLEPRNANAMNNLGAALLDVRRYPDSLRVLQLAVERRPDKPLFHFNLAKSFALNGDNSRAVEHFRTALRLKPDYADAHYQLGRLLSDQGQTDEAMEHFQEAVRLKPDNADFQNRLGIALAQTGRIKEAILHFRAALKSDPNGVGTYANLANALTDVGETAEARAMAQKGIDIAHSKQTQANPHRSPKALPPPASSDSHPEISQPP
jgi:protein O-mannosyl-transferase